MRTTASPARSISSRLLSTSPSTWEGSAGAPIVATARTDGRRWAACRTAAPPREWPMRMDGARATPSRCSAAATSSSTLPLKVVSANSPALSPRPVKSNRRTAIRRRISVREIATTAFRSLEQVKQCAKTAYASARPSAGSSRMADRSAPPDPGKERRLVVMAPLLDFGSRGPARLADLPAHPVHAQARRPWRPPP